MKPLRDPYFRKALIITALLAVILLIHQLKRFPAFVEKYYSEGLYIFISRSLRWLVNLIPFSIGDVFYLTLVALALFAVVKFFIRLWRKQYKKLAESLLDGLIYIQALVIIFYVLWGINYFREPVASRLNLTDTCYTAEDLVQVTNRLADSANFYRSNLPELQASNASSFIVAEQAINSEGYKDFNPKTKPSIFSALLNYTGTAGYYNPFSTEAQINTLMPAFLKPVTACHEMAHQAGFGAEDEANYIAYAAGTASPDRFLKYSAYYLGLSECLSDLRRRDSMLFKQIKIKISPGVLADFQLDRDYWMKYQGRIARVTGIFFDNFLKANNQPEGLRRYNLMVRLLIARYRKDNRIKSSCSSGSLSPRSE